MNTRVPQRDETFQIANRYHENAKQVCNPGPAIKPQPHVYWDRFGYAQRGAPKSKPRTLSIREQITIHIALQKAWGIIK